MEWSELDMKTLEFIINQAAKEAATETVRQLKQNGMLRESTDTAYQEITETLRKYYDFEERDPEITEALQKIKNDPYYEIFPLWFRYGYSIEDIAESLDVDTSTISRNKKRLSLKLWELIDKKQIGG